MHRSGCEVRRGEGRRGVKELGDDGLQLGAGAVLPDALVGAEAECEVTERLPLEVEQVGRLEARGSRLTATTETTTNSPLIIWAFWKSVSSTTVLPRPKWTIERWRSNSSTTTSILSGFSRSLSATIWSM